MTDETKLIPIRESEVERACERCEGEGEITFNLGYPDPQTEDWARCPDCHGTGVEPALKDRDAG